MLGLFFLEIQVIGVFTAIEGLEDLLGLWLRRMSTAPTTSESMATSKASVACTERSAQFLAHISGLL